MNNIKQLQSELFQRIGQKLARKPQELVELLGKYGYSPKKDQVADIYRETFRALLWEKGNFHQDICELLGLNYDKLIITSQRSNDMKTLSYEHMVMGYVSVKEKEKQIRRAVGAFLITLAVACVSFVKCSPF